MFMLIFEQLVKMFFIMLLAVFCFKIKLVNQEGNSTLSNLLLLVVNPCVVLASFQIEYDPALVTGLLLSFLAAAITHIAAIIISSLFIRKGSSPDYGIERFNAVYSNCGFIGIPLIRSVLGDTGVFYLTAYIVIFNLFSWTHGVLLMEKKYSAKNLKQGLLSPMFVCSIIAVILFFLRFRIPSLILDPINYISDMNTPLAMMIAGFSVAQADLKALCRKARLYYASAARLIIVPILVIPVLAVLPLPRTVALTTLIAAACPASATGTMMAIRYKQNYTYSSEIFAMTTVLSVITLPMVVLVAENFL